MEELRGYVSDLIYRNEENGYTVFEVTTDGDTMTCTGVIPKIALGESCKVEGDYVLHPLYGQQFKASSYETVRPEGKDALVRYLAGSNIKGIGEKMAQKIVDTFGDDTLRILDEEPERLAEIRGISESMARKIAVQAAGQRQERETCLFLAKYDITGPLAIKIFKTYGEKTQEILKTDPYQLADDIDGIGFVRADEIARKTGIAPGSDFRIRSGIEYVLSCALDEGSTCVPKDEVLKRAQELLEVPEDVIDIQLTNLMLDHRVVAKTKDVSGTDVPFVFLARSFRTEQRIAVHLRDLDVMTPERLTKEEIREKILAIEQQEKITLDDLQRKAVQEAAGGGVLILTGGPGTGKTTTINTIIRYFIDTGKSVVLAAPTGRAAKRMSEATGYEAQTIHRLLGSQGSSEQSYGFAHDASDPIDADVVIIDETSMVDLFLFDALLSAITPGTCLVLVGDTNQLPSVGPGQVLFDLIDSGKFRVIRLNTIFRQAQKSDIIVNAHRILTGEKLKLDNKSADFFFLPRTDPNVIYKHMVQLIRDMLPKYVHCTSSEIQVLTPMKKGPLGAIRLNEVLQEILNPKKENEPEIEAHGQHFRAGDKVMQTKNDYQMEWRVEGNFGMAIESGTGVFNGDFGVVQAVRPKEGEVVVLFDENRTVHYPVEQLLELDLAYAVTVHKSQGSEYPAVILPLLGGPPQLFHRNLLYTAITRARKCVVILGREDVLSSMEANLRESTRDTGLADRIRETIP